jgi:hypothetical protein
MEPLHWLDPDSDSAMPLTGIIGFNQFSMFATWFSIFVSHISDGRPLASSVISNDDTSFDDI